MNRINDKAKAINRNRLIAFALPIHGRMHTDVQVRMKRVHDREFALFGKRSIQKP